MSVTIIRQWTGRGARYYHYDTVEEATEDTRDFIVRNVGPDIDPQQLEAITRGVVALHAPRLPGGLHRGRAGARRLVERNARGPAANRARRRCAVPGRLRGSSHARPTATFRPGARTAPAPACRGEIAADARG